MPNSSSPGYTGPYPTVVATPGAHVGDSRVFETGEPSEASMGYLGALPTIVSTPGGQVQSGAIGYGGVDDTAAGYSGSRPTVAATPGGAVDHLAVGTAALDEAAAGYGGTYPTVSANPTKDAAFTEVPIRGGSASPGRTGALPSVASTPFSGVKGPGN